MANITLAAQKVLRWEGTTYTNDPLDAGGPTKFGVTLKTWQRYGNDKDLDGDIDADDVKGLEFEDFKLIFKIGFWDEIQGDKIKNQSVAEILSDWYYLSGTTAAKRTQKILGLPDDGEIGPATLKQINAVDPKWLHEQIKQSRIAHVTGIVTSKPSQKKWLKGWLNRIESYKYSA